MAVNVRAKVNIPARLKEAMRRSPEIVGEELTEGMKEVAVIRDDVRQNIMSARLFERGRLWRGVSAKVRRDAGRANVQGTVRAGARHSGIQEHGGTIRAKRGGFLVFPVGERVVITHVGGRKLKRERVETIGQKFVRVRSVTLKPKWYFRKGVKQGMPAVEASLDTHAHKAMKRVFEGEE